jgi:hypothetical protein
MTRRHQTHLGPTDTKSLTIVDFVPSSNVSSSCKYKSIPEPSDIVLSTTAMRNFLFQLPDELLLPIVELAAGGPGFESRVQLTTIYNNGIVLKLSQVCKRLKRVAQPLLYRNIHVKKPMAPPSFPVIKLHRTLRERVDLRQHCRYVVLLGSSVVLRLQFLLRGLEMNWLAGQLIILFVGRSLHIHIPDIGKPCKDVNDYLIAEDFANWLTKTRNLSIHGGFDDGRRYGDGSRHGDERNNERTWNLISQMAASFEDLEQVNINRESWGLYLPSIFKRLACPRLKALELHGISEWKHGPVQLELEVLETSTTDPLKRWFSSRELLGLLMRLI